MCPSSAVLIVSMRHLVYVTLYRWPFSVQVWMRLVQTCTLNDRLYRVIYTRCIDTINSPDDGHMAARNMQRIQINIHEKELCVKFVIYKELSQLLYQLSRYTVFQAPLWAQGLTMWEAHPSGQYLNCPLENFQLK